MVATMSDKPQAVDIVAAREHSITSRRTRVHVIVCHDLNARAHSLYEMFRYADRVSPEVLEALTRELAGDIVALRAAFGREGQDHQSSASDHQKLSWKPF